MAPSKTPFLAIPDPKKSNLPHVCPDKIFLRCVVTILLFLKVAWDVRDMLDAKKYDWDSIKKILGTILILILNFRKKENITKFKIKIKIVPKIFL